MPYTDKRRPFVQYGYDGLDRRTSETRLLFGTVQPDKREMPSTGVARITTDYDIFDRPTKVTDANNYTKQTVYDPDDNAVRITQQVWKGSEEGYKELNSGFTSVTTSIAYDAAGRLIQVLDPRGNTSKKTYDQLGNVLTETNANGYVAKAYAYTADGLLQNTYQPRVGAGVAAKSFSPGATSAFVQTEVRDYGNRVYPTAVHAALMNVPAGSSGDAKTSYTYDYAGRPRVTTLPDGSSTEQRYDARGDEIYTISPEGFITNKSYDGAGRPTGQQQPLRAGNTTDSTAFPTGGGLSSSYQYDGAGNLTRKVENGLETGYVYNSLGKVISEERPHLSGTSTISKLRTYRLDGLMTAETTYDYTGNLASKPDVLANDPSLTVTSGNVTLHQYDLAGNASAETSLVGYNNVLSPGTKNTQEFQRSFLTNGLGQRYKRTFSGTTSVFAEQRLGNGTSTGLANYLTYWKYDANGNVTENWNTPSNASNLPIDTTLKQNYFSYQYSPTNKEIHELRDVESWVQPKKVLDGVTKGALLAATNGAMTAFYNERDLISRAQVGDQLPLSVDAKLDPLTVNTDYTYYLDGKRYASAAATTSEFWGYDNLLKSTKTGGGTRRVDGYDARGRETSVWDSNGTNGPNDLNYVGPTRTTTNYGRTSSDASVNSSVLTSDGAVLYQESTTSTVGGLVANSGSKKFPGTKPGQDKTSSMVYAKAGNSLVGVVWSQKDTNLRDSAETVTQSDFGYDERGNRVSEHAVGTTSTVGTKSVLSSYVSDHSLTPNPLNVVQSEATTVSLKDPSGNVVSTQKETSSYAIDTRGNRIEVTGTGKYAGYSKRYDADERVATFNQIYDTTNGHRGFIQSTGWSATDYADYRYDPFGNQMLSSAAAFQESGNKEYSLSRETYTTYAIGGDVQVIRKRRGVVEHVKVCNGNYCSVPINSTAKVPWDAPENEQVRDQSYTLADGMNEKEGEVWGVIYTFSALEQADLQPLEAPVTPTSAIVRIDPASILPPLSANPNVPSPGDIKAPAKEDKKPESKDEQPFGVTTLGMQPLAALPSLSPSPDSTPTQQAAPQTQTQTQNPFGVNLAPLEAPSSVLPGSLNNLNVTGIVPAAGGVPVLPDVGKIEAPGQANVPPVGATPADGVASITPAAGSGLGTPNIPGVAQPGQGIKDIKPAEGVKGNVKTLDVPPPCDSALGKVDPRRCPVPAASPTPKNVDDSNAADNAQRDLQLGYDLKARALITDLRTAAQNAWGERAAAALDPIANMTQNWVPGERLDFYTNLKDDLVTGRLSEDGLYKLSGTASKWRSAHPDNSAPNQDNSTRESYRAYVASTKLLKSTLSSLDGRTAQTTREFSDASGYTDGYRAITGRDPLTGQEIPGWQRLESGLLTAATVLPFVGEIKPELGLGKATLEAGEVAGRDIASSEANAFGKAFSCLHSFTPDTPVLTRAGLLPIASLSVGQDVLAYNETKGQNEYQPVQQVFINQDPQVTFLQVDQELVTTTPEHPFYVKAQSDDQARPKPIGHENLNEHWVGAGHLKVGDKIQKADGGFGVVKYVNTVTQTRTMYNLEVRDAHTFFVGTRGWLVHNASCPLGLAHADDLIGEGRLEGAKEPSEL